MLGTRVGPATGDASAIALWLGLLIACIGTIVWLIAGRKRKKS
ncbi:MAG: LPXTG cell wall anchor domain-containing protein [Lachnospiraceae bacterium]|nr:LPXTG cell wall anchor domain-containing protein [Lachnospiraceae bacterium]